MVLTVADAAGLTSEANVVVEVNEKTVVDPDPEPNPDVEEKTDGPGFSGVICLAALGTAILIFTFGRRRRR